MNTIVNIFCIAVLIFLAVVWVFIGWKIYLNEKMHEKALEELKKQPGFDRLQYVDMP